MALVTIGLTLASDVSALVFAPLPESEAAADGRLALIAGLIVVSGATAIVGSSQHSRCRRLLTPVAPTTIARKITPYETTTSHGSSPNGEAARTILTCVVTMNRAA